MNVMRSAIANVSDIFSRWFHKRNIIIVSEHKVNHIPISGHLQFAGLVLALGGICWASYSTGSFMAARSALKQQGQALRSVTNAHIENSFSAVYQNPVAAKMNVDVSPLPYKRPEANVAVNGPIAALSGLDNAKLVARIALLENKVAELKYTNEAIVQRVHDKTAGRIDDLKNLISDTGLNLNDLKKQYSENKKRGRIMEEPSEGGPYIPADIIGMTPEAKEMFSSLDDLTVLSQIVGGLPLGRPVAGSEQSTFGHRIDPFTGHLAFHSGLDIAGPVGSKVHSTAAGKVVAAGRNGAYGNAIDINHGFGVVTRYGHLAEVQVKAGDEVKKGDVIGIQGSTGRSTGPHVHYEVRYHDQPINPKNFLEAGIHVSKE